MAKLLLKQKGPEGAEVQLEREVLYDANAIAAIEEHMKCSIAEVLKKRSAFAVVRALLWGGLLHENPDLTLREAGQLLTRKNQGDALLACVKALADFFAERS